MVARGDNYSPDKNGLTRSIHIVRRYGRIGGMEKYVWELTHQLARSGHRVMVICHLVHDWPEDDVAPDTLQVNRIDLSFNLGPRWVKQLMFSRAVYDAVRQVNDTGWVLHSHERTGIHQVSTFHAQSIHNRKKRILDFLSPRLWAWEWMEKRELAGPHVIKVVPVSGLTRKELLGLYPDISNVLSSPIEPAAPIAMFPTRNKQHGKVIGFMGVEWKRKGLDLLVKAVSAIRHADPEVTLCVAGCAEDDIRHLFEGWNKGYEVLGWIKDTNEFFSRIDILALPSRQEGYGMVVAEACAVGVPVVVSDHCGIAGRIGPEQGIVFKADSHTALRLACEQLLASPFIATAIDHTWEDVSAAYVEVYKDVAADMIRISTSNPPISTG